MEARLNSAIIRAGGSDNKLLLEVIRLHGEVFKIKNAHEQVTEDDIKRIMEKMDPSFDPGKVMPVLIACNYLDKGGEYRPFEWNGVRNLGKEYISYELLQAEKMKPALESGPASVSV